MPFNLNSIPPDGRTPQQIQQHLDLWNRANDIWLVHNPDEEDYEFFYNRKFEPTPYIIPGRNKDIGFGPGNLEMRFALAKKYAERKAEQMINVISKADWDKKKVEYRLEERGQMEERLALRTNNPDLLKKIVPQLLLGCIRRSTEGVGRGEATIEKTVDTSLSTVEQVMEQIGLTDKEISHAHASQQTQLSEEEKKKQDLINSIV